VYVNGFPTSESLVKKRERSASNDQAGSDDKDFLMTGSRDIGGAGKAKKRLIQNLDKNWVWRRLSQVYLG
jgi:hypothetical protein